MNLKQQKLDCLAKRAPGYKIIQELYVESNRFTMILISTSNIRIWTSTIYPVQKNQKRF